jgi:fumarate hydratase class II
MAYNLLQSLEFLSTVTDLFTRKCVTRIAVNPERIKRNLEQSFALAIKLGPAIGYDKAAQIARQAHESGGSADLFR